VINKTDLAPHVGADLGVMEADTQRMRRGKPYVMTNLKTLAGVAEGFAAAGAPPSGSLAPATATTVGALANTLCGPEWSGAAALAAALGGALADAGATLALGEGGGASVLDSLQ
ncbi:MAG TPA: hypothetical protein PLR99_30855, partial [Polyangiaceae bacterium]|nr:hypothetical protein [Polyangiaceae bacterium]